MAKKAKKEEVQSVSTVVAGSKKGFNGEVNCIELPSGSFKVIISMKHKDMTGREWVSSVSSEGATVDAAIEGLDAAFAKSTGKIKSMARRVLDNVKSIKTEISKRPIQAIDLNTLPLALLKKMAAGYPSIPANATKEELVKRLSALRAAKDDKDPEATETEITEDDAGEIGEL